MLSSPGMIMSWPPLLQSLIPFLFVCAPYYLIWSSHVTLLTLPGGQMSLAVTMGCVGKTRCACGKQVGFKWVVGKRARAPRYIYRPFVLLGMYICQYDAWKE